MKKAALNIMEVVTTTTLSETGSIRLARKEAATVRGKRLTCTAGRIWITKNGDPTDYILSAGESLELGTRAVVSGLAEGSYRVA